MLTQKPDGRTPAQASVDRFLAVLAGNVVHRKGGSLGAVLLQKIVFQAKLSLSGSGIAVPHFEFMRYRFGPYSPTLKEDEVLLRGHGVLSTSYGKHVVESFRSSIEECFPEAVRAVERSASHRALWSAKRAMAEAYDVKVKLSDGSMTKLEALRLGVELGFDASMKPEPVIPAHLLVDLKIALAGPERRKAGKKFTAAAADDLRALLS